MYLSGKYGTLAISEALNRDEIPGPKGKDWSATAVQRLLVHEFHMGNTYYGRKEWRYDNENDTYLVELRDESEWIKGKGNHKPLKTVEQHEKILAIMSNNTKIPKRSRQGVFVTTGLLYCKKCNTLMNYSVGKLSKKTGECWDYTKCSHKSPKGEKCPQKALKMTPDFYNAIYNAVINDYLSPNKLKSAQEHAEEHSRELALIELKKKEIADAEKAIAFFTSVAKKGGYTPEEYIQLKQKEEKIIKDRSKELKKLENEAVKDYLTQEELEQYVRNFKDNWNQLDNTGKNKLLKTFVKKIFYDREGDTVTLEVVYL